MNPLHEPDHRGRYRRAAVGFVAGLAIASGVLWASALGAGDRDRSTRFAPLDFSAACVIRDGPDAVAYIAGAASPVGWRCAHPDGDGWKSSPITPDEGCALKFGLRSSARVTKPDNPFTWECRR